MTVLTCALCLTSKGQGHKFYDSLRQFRKNSPSVITFHTNEGTKTETILYSFEMILLCLNHFKNMRKTVP